ncbi:MAG: glycosyl hydrolase [Opitutales bacterium]
MSTNASTQSARPIFLLALIGVCAALGLPGAEALSIVPIGDPEPRSNFGAPLEDEDVILHGVGQKRELSMANYSGAMPADLQPLIWMHYFKLHPELTAQHAREFVARQALTLRRYPGEKRLQVSLSFDGHRTGFSGKQYTGIGEQADEGYYDEIVEALAESLGELQTPVYVRIGYEFNGHWNVYNPGQYQRVFRRYAALMRKHLGEHVATLWCAHPISPLSRLMEFYPGDEWVDWWSIDLFSSQFLKSPNTDDFILEAARRQKPVYIAESTPEGVGVHDQAQWEAWMHLYFNIMYRHPNVKAFHFIHRNWGAWSWSDWGDSRLAFAPDAMAVWQRELRRPIFRHAREGGSSKTDPLAAYRGLVDRAGQRQIHLQPGVPVELDFGPNPPGAPWNELYLAIEMSPGEGEASVTLHLEERLLGEFRIPHGMDLRLYDLAFESTLAEGQPLHITVTSDHPCQIDGPAAGPDGIAPQLIASGP